MLIHKFGFHVKYREYCGSYGSIILIIKLVIKLAAIKAAAETASVQDEHLNVRPGSAEKASASAILFLSQL